MHSLHNTYSDSYSVNTKPNYSHPCRLRSY